MIGSPFPQSTMRYISTRGQTRPHTFSEAVEAGLAPDGGLFLPDSWPDIRDKLSAWEKLDYAGTGGGVSPAVRAGNLRARNGTP